MLTHKTIAIIGAGNGGQSAAFELTSKGFVVHIHDINQKIIEGIRERGGIRAFGQLEGFNYFQALFPALSKMANRLEVGLNNGNPVTHPAPTLLNVARIERGETFLFYKEGITSAIAKINEKLDSERLALCRALGFKGIPLTERLSLTGYADRIYSSALEAYHRSEAFAPIGAPKSLKDRYILEDIPYGLVTFASLADHLNVPTPTMQLVIRLASEIAGINFWERGITLKALGLDRMDAAGLLRIVETAKSPWVSWSA